MIDDKRFYVYKHLKKGTDEVFYIGKGTGSRATRKTTRNTHWNRVEAKYGRDVVIVQDGLTNKEALELEVRLIEEIGLDNLTNMTEGGEPSFVGDKNPNWRGGRTFCGCGNRVNSGVEKCRTCFYDEDYIPHNLGSKHTEETRKKMRDSHQHKIGWKAKIVINLDNGIFYESMTEAAKVYGINRSTLVDYLTGKVRNKTNLILI